MRDINPQALALAAGVGIGLVVLWQITRAGRAVADAVADGAINPTSPNNLAYRGTNAVGAAVTGNESFSLGAWLYETFNPGAVEAERKATGAAGTSTATAPYVPDWGPASGETFAGTAAGAYYYPNPNALGL